MALGQIALIGFFKAQHAQNCNDAGQSHVDGYGKRIPELGQKPCGDDGSQRSTNNRSP